MRSVDRARRAPDVKGVQEPARVEPKVEARKVEAKVEHKVEHKKPEVRASAEPSRGAPGTRYGRQELHVAGGDGARFQEEEDALPRPPDHA